MCMCVAAFVCCLRKRGLPGGKDKGRGRIHPNQPVIGRSKIDILSLVGLVLLWTQWLCFFP